MKNTIANTILKQLGGNKIIAMVGAYNLIDLGNGLQFDFKGSRKVNKIQIILNGGNTYDINFYKYNRRTFDCPLVNEFTDVYAETLTTLFESVTGLCTSI